MKEEKQSWLYELVLFWKRIFDYKGTSGKREYLVPVLVHVALFIVTVLLYVISAFSKRYYNAAGIPAAILGIYLLLSCIPFIALHIRRLRDSGKSAWWTCLMAIVGIGFVVLLFICVSDGGRFSVFEPGQNIEAGVYGPPPFDPGKNIEVDVYGPPPFDEEEEPIEEIILPEISYSPELNEEACVYGPPEMFEVDEDDEQ